MRTIKLKVKAKIYQYTGIYLARNDEPAKHLDKGSNPGLFAGVELGMWQAKHGFHRPLSRIRYFRPRWLWSTACWLDELWSQVKHDLKAGKG